MKASARLHHKPPLRSALHMAEITTDKDKITGLVKKPATTEDMVTTLMNKLVTTRDMVKALRNTADMVDTEDIDMDGGVDRHIIRE